MLVLVAFSLQSFLVQTHIHNLPLSVSAAGGVSLAAPHDGKAPLDIDKCLFCQEYMHAGAYLTPAAAAVLPPYAAVSLLTFVVAPFVAARTPSHNWMGRAPPRL
jgi:hypothetical protein